MPAIRTCPDCGHVFAGTRGGQRVDRRKALEAWGKLRDVQRDICWFLYRHRLVTKLQIASAYFTARDEGNRKNSAQNNLNHLMTVGLIRRMEGERKQHYRVFYTLTVEGVYACQAEEKNAGSKVRRIKALKADELLDSPRWRHHLYVTDVLTTFVAAERRGQGDLLDYRVDGETCFVFPFLGSRRRLQPDAMFTWSTHAGAQLAFLELENKHSSLADAEEKIRKYVWMESAGTFRGDYFRRTLAVNKFPVLLVVGVRKAQIN